MEFSSLWVGGELSKLQILSIQSFLANGHSFNLFVYDSKIEVPQSTKLIDARLIMKEESIFTVGGSFAPFSDQFRYRMIRETGCIWVDVDNICLSKDWPTFENDIVLGYEFHDWLGRDRITGSVLGYKKESEFADFLVNNADSFDKSTIHWEQLGSELISKGVQIFGYENLIQNREVFNPIVCTSWEKLWSEKDLDFVLKESEKSLSINCYNEMGRRAGIDRNNFRSGSALDYFWNKYF